MELLGRLVDLIIQPAIYFIFSLGFLLFLWGLVMFISNPTDQGKRKTGLQHMMWGIVGMFVMISVQGIISLIDDTFGLGTFDRSGLPSRTIPNSGSGGFGVPPGS